MSSPSPPSWRLEFDSVESPLPKSKAASLDPPGYNLGAARDFVAGSSTLTRRRDPRLTDKKQQALWQRATTPFRQVGFMCFMMWMMGNSIQIFSIIMALSGLAGPVMAIYKSGEQFPADPERKLDTLTPRLLYCLINAGQLVFVLYKLNAMGLLPTHASDWLATVPAPASLEVAMGPL